MKATRIVPLLLLLLAALAIPSSAAALKLEIVNASGREDVHVTVVGDEFDVESAVNDEPQLLSAIPDQTLTINKIVSGRVYISYGAGVKEGVTFDSPTRFDWVELNVHPSNSDVANLTAVDQFGIGMRLDTYNAAETHLEGLGAANSNTIFAALQQIPGGPQATVRNGSEIVRVLSPNKSSAYPDLGEYVRSMAGQTITLHSVFFSEAEKVSSVYSGTFAADGSITLDGQTKPANPPNPVPSSVVVPAAGLIADIYTGGGTEANDFESALRRDLLAGFSTGLWGGRYGNDAIDFCTVPSTNPELWDWCPHFNKPAFGDARASLSPFPTCDQYAAVINQYSDSYGNPYSDASKRVTVPIVKSEGSGEAVETLRLTIQADSGNAQPEAGGNPNCGAAPVPVPAGGAPAARSWLRVKFFKRGVVRGKRARVGRVLCSGRCGRVRMVAKQGRRVLGRSRAFVRGRRSVLVLRLNRRGKRVVARRGRLKAKLVVRVKPPGSRTVVRRHAVRLVGKR